MSPRKNIHKENQNLISLAVKCKFITVHQEQEILSWLIEIYNINPDYKVLNIFKKRAILTQERIDFLFALQSHLKLKMLDKKFGEIGVSNRFVTAKHVDHALTYQDAYFRKHHESKKIGDILVERNEMSPADKTAILLTQDRVQEQFLEQAIYDIAKSEMERMTINKRFGAIAVKYGLISIDELNQALRVQKNESESGKPKRYLGQILQELFQLRESDILTILKTQQQIEKERLSLEKAVNRYKSEISSSKRLNNIFEFTITGNKMEAHIHRRKESFEEIQLDHFHNWLKLNGIRSGLASDELIKAFLSDSEVNEQMKIAAGIPCTMPVDETVEYFFDTKSSMPQNHEAHVKAVIRKGDILATLTPHKAGVPGTDVMGHAILPPEPRLNHLMCGPGVVHRNSSFIADQDGIPLLINQRTIMIEPYITDRKNETVSDHIRNDTKKTYHNVNLTVQGHIDTEGVVNCHSLTIHGDLLGRVDAAGDIHVKGTIGSNESIPGESEFRTVVMSGGHLNVSKNITHSKILASKGFTAPKSSVFYSEIHAMETILVNNVHSSPEHPSVLQVGSIPDLKVNTLNRLIDEETTILRTLRKQDELDTITLKLKQKIKTQTEYLEKQHVIKYLMEICHSDSTEFDTPLEQRIQIHEPPDDEGTPREPGMRISNNESTLTFMDDILDRVRGLTLDRQRRFLAQQLSEVSDLYRTAVNEADRYTAEHRARHHLILKKTGEQQSKIEHQEKKIEELMIQKDYLMHQKKPPAPPSPPQIRVKNMVEKNTIIKGIHTSMVIKDSIYGIRIREVKNMKTHSYDMVIDGYYD